MLSILKAIDTMVSVNKKNKKKFFLFGFILHVISLIFQVPLLGSITGGIDEKKKIKSSKESAKTTLNVSLCGGLNYFAQNPSFNKYLLFFFFFYLHLCLEQPSSF